MDMCNALTTGTALHALPSSGADDPCFPWLDDTLSMSLICLAHSRHVAILPVPEGMIPCMGIPRYPSKVSCVSIYMRPLEPSFDRICIPLETGVKTHSSDIWIARWG